MVKNVAEVVGETLEAAGVKHCWGVPGDTLNYVTDAIRRSKIEWIGVRHEEGAALAAAGRLAGAHLRAQPGLHGGLQSSHVHGAHAPHGLHVLAALSDPSDP